MSTVIRTSGLTKHYGRVHALDGLDLSLPAGQGHGFLRPDGGGKTTQAERLAGHLRAVALHHAP